jgi:predicted Zn-dependent protease
LREIETGTLNKPIASIVVLLLLALAPLLGSQRAQAQGISFIRDAEIERTLRIYANPLFQAAGLNPRGIRIFLVNSKTLNAFVAGGQNMFIFTGLIMETEDPLEIIGVIAHETGHISGGHLASRPQRMEETQTGILVSYLLGLGAALASGQPGLGAAVISGGQDLALKGLLRYTRSQESAADQAAITYLNATGQSPRGLMVFMQKLSGQEALLLESQDPYLRTHPLSNERVAAFRRAAEDSPYKDTPTPEKLLDLHQRMVAKLVGYLEPLRLVLARYPDSDDSLYARYARAIAYFRAQDLTKALTVTDSLLEDEPDNPFFHEMRGQMLFEFGRLEEALKPYETASGLLPDEPTILLSLARVQLELDDPQLNDSALDNLRKVVNKEPDNSFAWRLLATAYSRRDDQAMTIAALAESDFARGDYREAVARAKRAQQLLPSGSAAWLRAQDLELEADRLFRKSKQ